MVLQKSQGDDLHKSREATPDRGGGQRHHLLPASSPPFPGYFTTFPTWPRGTQPAVVV